MKPEFETLTFFLITFALYTVMAGNKAAEKIETNLRSKLEKGEKANIMIAFASTSPVLESITYPADASRGDRATLTQQTLEAHVNRCQAGVARLLQERNVNFKQFWINNNISVREATQELVKAIAEDPQVVKIKEEQVAHLLGNTE